MRPRTLIVLTMSLCGLLAGLAGTIVVLGVTHTMTSSFGTTVGFDAIAVALLGALEPVRDHVLGPPVRGHAGRAPA